MGLYLPVDAVGLGIVGDGSDSRTGEHQVGIDSFEHSAGETVDYSDRVLQPIPAGQMDDQSVVP
jgi:hypothetical protein